MRIYSRETRDLRADHAQALRELRQHRYGCVDCERAARKKDRSLRCAEGQALATAEGRLLAQSRKAAELDLQPHPDQAAFDFGSDDPAALVSP